MLVYYMKSVYTPSTWRLLLQTVEWGMCVMKPIARESVSRREDEQTMKMEEKQWKISRGRIRLFTFHSNIIWMLY